MIGMVLNQPEQQSRGATPQKTDTLFKDLISLQVDMILDIIWIMLLFGAPNDQFIQQVGTLFS